MKVRTLRGETPGKPTDVSEAPPNLRLALKSMTEERDSAEVRATIKWAHRITEERSRIAKWYSDNHCEDVMIRGADKSCRERPRHPYCTSCANADRIAHGEFGNEA